METDDPDDIRDASGEAPSLRNQIVYSALDVISSITSSSAILQFIYSPENQLWRLLESSIDSADMSVGLKAIEISTFIAMNW